MRHQYITIGMLVSLRGDAKERYGNEDLDGNPLPDVARVREMRTEGHYREPWIYLEGVNGAFRAKELTSDTRDHCPNTNLRYARQAGYGQINPSSALESARRKEKDNDSQ